MQSQRPIRPRFYVEWLEDGPMSDCGFFFFCCYCSCHGTAEIQIVKTYLSNTDTVAVAFIRAPRRMSGRCDSGEAKRASCEANQGEKLVHGKSELIWLSPSYAQLHCSLLYPPSLSQWEGQRMNGGKTAAQ